MPAKNRISISFSDSDFELLERLSAHCQKSKAELVRTMVHEFLEKEPDRFRRKTSIEIERKKNIVLKDNEV